LLTFLKTGRKDIAMKVSSWILWGVGMEYAKTDVIFSEGCRE
jgi:hypothetical protein